MELYTSNGRGNQQTTYFPNFDRNALDSARMIFGVEDPQVLACPGSLQVDEFIQGQTAAFEALDFPDWNSPIEEGSRNNAMSHYAGRILVRLGNTDEARRL